MKKKLTLAIITLALTSLSCKKKIVEPVPLPPVSYPQTVGVYSVTFTYNNNFTWRWDEK